MPIDVIDKAIQGNTIRQGCAVQVGGCFGAGSHITTLVTPQRHVPSSGEVYTKYDTRFDDRTYYST